MLIITINKFANCPEPVFKKSNQPRSVLFSLGLTPSVEPKILKLESKFLNHVLCFHWQIFKIKRYIFLILTKKPGLCVLQQNKMALFQPVYFS